MIAYYFPPMGGSGVQRPLKFAKYLKNFGWEPIVVAPEAGMYHTFDDTLLAELKESSIRVERVENLSLFKSRGKSKRRISHNQFTSAILKWLTSWFYLPDNKKGWIDSAVDKCIQIANKETIHAAFSTAPPYSNLIAARKLKEQTGLPVVMDLRDDWLESHLIRYPTKWHYNKMRKMERDTLTSADHITVVNDYYRDKMMQRLDGSCPGITTIPNGYDKSNFEGLNPAGVTNSFTILYSGLFYGSRKPDWFLTSVRKVMDRNPEFSDLISIQFQGGLENHHWKTINRLDLTSVVTDFGYVNHQVAVQNLINADVLFLTLGDRDFINSVTPGKVFEYMGSGKPILAYIPEGATSELLSHYGASRCAGIKDVEKGADHIESFFHQWKRGSLPQGSSDFAGQFERRETTSALSNVLQNSINDKGK